MTKLIQKKLQERIGASLIETLATVVLLGLMGIAMTAGVVAVNRAYAKVVRKANEQILLSTTIVEMRDIIRHSTDYKEKEGKKYFRTDKGYWVEFINPEDNSGISVQYNMYNLAEDTFTAHGAPVALVPGKNGEISKIHSVFTAISDSKNGVYTIEGIRVKGDDDDNGLAPINYSISRFRFKNSPESGGGS